MWQLSRTIVLAAVLAWGVADKAQAAPITLTAVDTVIFNFDFPGTETYSSYRICLRYFEYFQ